MDPVAQEVRDTDLAKRLDAAHPVLRPATRDGPRALMRPHADSDTYSEIVAIIVYFTPDRPFRLRVSPLLSLRDATIENVLHVIFSVLASECPVYPPSLHSRASPPPPAVSRAHADAASRAGSILPAPRAIKAGLRPTRRKPGPGSGPPWCYRHSAERGVPCGYCVLRPGPFLRRLSEQGPAHSRTARRLLIFKNPVYEKSSG